MCEKTIVDICNKIAGSERFTWLDDIDRQSVMACSQGLAFHRISNDSRFLVNIQKDYLYKGHSCNFLDSMSGIHAIILVNADGEIISRGCRTYPGVCSIYTTELIGNPYSTGFIHMYFNNINVIYSDAKIKEIAEIPMGGYTFSVPIFDDRLFDTSIYKELFSNIYDSDSLDELQTVHFYINRSQCKAVINISQATYGSSVSKDETINIDFSGWLKIHFGKLENSKKDIVMDIIMPLIDAAIPQE